MMLRLASLIGLACTLAGGVRADDGGFARDVQPLLARRCLACHGPHVQEAGLRLDDPQGAAAELPSGSRAIVPGRPEESAILARITATDATRMPPDGPPLTPAQARALAAWITAGAPWREHWSFQPLRRPTPPPAAPGTDPIDAFIVAGLASRDLSPPPPADRATLLRRVTYDLTGLPPSAREMQDFLADGSPDAWETVVDRLLASPRYGEQWARHWLDLVRYADTNSFERDGDKPHAWRYRDYVIRSLNDDKPFDRFVLEQLAGDELPDTTPDALIATGYYRLGVWDDEPADPLQARYDWLDDLVATTGQVFLGLTVNCARCHDHKIDPLPQRDYYALLAFFQAVTPMGDRQMNPAWIERALPTSGHSVEEARHEAEELARRRIEARDGIAAIEARIREQGPQARDDLARADLAAWQARLAALDAEQAALPRALVVTETGTTAPDTYLLPRGNPHAETRPDRLVEPAFPAVLRPPRPAIAAPATGRTTGRRLALARWIASPDNPLTARVIANRIWQHHFGRGIVRSASDFGLQGDPPTHPELLDWLATELIAHGWRLKPLQRRILMSTAYRAAARGDAAGPDRDPLNDRFWRFEMRRLTAEELRDSIHVVSGAFNPAMFGPGVYPTLPAEVLAGQSRPGSGWGTSPPEEQARRSIYIHVKRSLLTPLLADFDLADADSSCPVRFVTTQPTQALGMLNGEFLQRQAKAFATRVRRAAAAGREDDTPDRVRRALEIALVRPATAAEVAAGTALVDRLAAQDEVGPDRALEIYCLMVLNLNEFAYLD